MQARFIIILVLCISGCLALNLKRHHDKPNGRQTKENVNFVSCSYLNIPMDSFQLPTDSRILYFSYDEYQGILQSCLNTNELPKNVTAKPGFFDIKIATPFAVSYNYFFDEIGVFKSFTFSTDSKGALKELYLESSQYPVYFQLLAADKVGNFTSPHATIQISYLI